MAWFLLTTKATPLLFAAKGFVSIPLSGRFIAYLNHS